MSLVVLIYSSHVLTVVVNEESDRPSICEPRVELPVIVEPDFVHQRLDLEERVDHCAKRVL